MEEALLGNGIECTCQTPYQVRLQVVLLTGMVHFGIILYIPLTDYVQKQNPMMWIVVNVFHFRKNFYSKTSSPRQVVTWQSTARYSSCSESSMFGRHCL
jgi:hypothetical protein